MRSKLVIGLVQLGAAALLVLGGFTLKGGTVEYITVTGTSTGATVSLDGHVLSKTVVVPLTMTGGTQKISGGLKYNSSNDPLACNPLTTTGAVTDVSIYWINAPAPAEGELSVINKSLRLHGSTGSVVHGNLDNMTSGTGAMFRWGTGTLTLGTTECLKLALYSAPTTSGSGYLVYSMRDDLSK